MPLDREKFVKVLRMTESVIDAEALSAVRMANKMLREAGVGWGGLISGTRAPIRTAQTQPSWVRPAPTKNITEALDFLVDREGGEWEGLRREWTRRKQLSPYEQRRIFERVYQLENVDEEPE